MKHIKLFENNSIYYIVVEMYGSLPDRISLFTNKESADNYVINIIHESDSERAWPSKESYGCKDIFDVDELIEYWNEKNNGNEIYLESIKISENIELKPDLKLRKDTKKYNL